jgi:hypothetical protein
MVIYVNEAGSDRTELLETLDQEGVNYREVPTDTTRELGSASWRMVEVQANLPEVRPLPPGYSRGDVDARAWRLPSGRLIISDMDGNLEQIASPGPPGR